MWSFLPGILALIYLTINKICYNTSPKFDLKTLTILCLILGLGFCSSLWAVSAEETIDRSIKLSAVILSGYIFLSAIKTIENTDHLNLFRPLLPLTLSFACTLIVFELNMDALSYKLIRGDFDIKVRDHVFNRGAVSITLCFFSALALLFYTKIHHIIKLIFIASTLALMLCTDSQSAQLAILLGLITFFVFPFKTSIAWNLLIIVISLLIILAPFLSSWLFNTLATSLDSMAFFSKGYAAHRLEIWDYVSRYALNSPYWGYGLEATRTITDFDSQEIYQKGTSILHPHNFALQLWLEFGVLGAIVGAMFCSYLILKIKNLDCLLCKKIMLSTYISTLSVAATGYGMWQSWWVGLIFFSLGLCIFTCKALNKPMKIETPLTDHDTNKQIK
jgi:O-antigen ligase